MGFTSSKYINLLILFIISIFFTACSSVSNEVDVDKSIFIKLKNNDVDEVVPIFETKKETQIEFKVSKYKKVTPSYKKINLANE